MRNTFLDVRTARDIDAVVSKILKGLGNPEPPLNLDDVRALQQLDRQYYSSVDDGPLREFVSKASVSYTHLPLHSSFEKCTQTLP